MDAQLTATQLSQGTWSETANTLKARYDTVRKICFLLSIVAALLAALASQLPDMHDHRFSGSPRLILSICSTVMLAIVGFLTGRFLGGQNAGLWIRARVASEALKRAAYTYAAAAAPYEDPASRSARLAAERQAIENQVDELTAHRVAPMPGRTPADLIPRDVYIDKRPLAQAKWYEDAANVCNQSARRLRAVEFVLALVAAVITALIGVTGKAPIAGLQFDFIAITAVLTTVAGAILAYIEASKYDYLVTSYRAAARQLRELLTEKDAALQASPADWSAFVQKVEAVLATENGAWIVKVGQVK